MAEINLIKEETINVNLASEKPINAQVQDINYIPGYKAAEEERRANELERIANENERESYYEDIQEKVNNGEMDGKNTVYVGKEEPTDDYYNVWIDPEGTPEISADNLVFEDNETLQDKYDNGELKGDAPVKGVDYFTEEDINSLNIPDKTSQLTNDSNFATESYVDNEIATFDFIKVVSELPETGLDNRIYFVPKTDTQTQDLFDEYVWINGTWEWVTTKQLEVDLTSYYTKEEVDTKLEENSTYSTEEKIVGTWINGKPLYRKVVEFSASSSIVNNSVSIDVLGLNVDAFVSVSGIAKTNEGFGCVLLSDTQAITIEDAGRVDIYFNNSSQAYSYTGHVIIEYTKTTD